MTSIGRSTPPGSPSRPAETSEAPEVPRRARAPRAPRDPQAPAPLRRRTAASYGEGDSRPRAELPSSSSLHALPPGPSLASLSWRSGEASVERFSETSSGSLPSLPSGTQPGPTLSFLESDVAARSEPLPGSPSPATASLNEADFDELVPAPADAVIDIEHIVDLLQEMAAGKRKLLLVGPDDRDADRLSTRRRARGLFNHAFDENGQLHPPEKNQYARSIHKKLDSLLIGTQLNRELAARLQGATQLAGKPAWDKVAQVIDGLIEAAAALDPTRALEPGESRPKKAELQRRLEARNLRHVATALQQTTNARGIFKRDDTRSDVQGVLHQIERMARGSPYPAHRETLLRWNQLMERQALVPPPVIRSISASFPAPSLPCLAARANLLIEGLDMMKPGEVGIKEAENRIGTTWLNPAFTAQGEFKAEGIDLHGELQASPHLEDRAAATALDQASQRAIQRNRVHIAETLIDLSAVIRGLKDGRYAEKKDAVAVFDDNPDKTQTCTYIKQALLANGQLNLNHPSGRSLIVKLNWLRRNGEAEHQHALADFEAALNQPQGAHGRHRPPRMPRPSARAAPAVAEAAAATQVRRRGTAQRGGRAAAHQTLPRLQPLARPARATLSGSVGSVAASAQRPGTPRAASGARSGIGVGFEVEEEVQSRRAASPSFDQHHLASVPGTPLSLPSLPSLPSLSSLSPPWSGSQTSGSHFYVPRASALPSLGADRFPSLVPSISGERPTPGSDEPEVRSRLASSAALPRPTGGPDPSATLLAMLRSRVAPSAAAPVATGRLDPSATLLAMLRSRAVPSAAPSLSTERLDLSATLLAMQRSNALSAGLQRIIVEQPSQQDRAALRPHVPAMMAIDRVLHAANMLPLIDQLRHDDLNMLQGLPLDQSQHLALAHFIPAQRTLMRPAAPGSER